MDGLFPSIRYNLANLARFEGRDSKALFWPWAILVFLVGYALQTLAMLPAMAEVMTRSILIGQQVGSQGNGEPDSAAAAAEQSMREAWSSFGDLWPAIAAIDLVAIALLAAAVARRLHDRDRSGWWGLIPIPFLAAGVANLPMTDGFMAGDPIGAVEGLSLALSGGLWIALIVLVAMLVRDGDRGANRFGEPSPPRA